MIHNYLNIREMLSCISNKVWFSENASYKFLYKAPINGIIIIIPTGIGIEKFDIKPIRNPTKYPNVIILNSRIIILFCFMYQSKYNTKMYNNKCASNTVWFSFK